MGQGNNIKRRQRIEIIKALEDLRKDLGGKIRRTIVRSMPYLSIPKFKVDILYFPIPNKYTIVQSNGKRTIMDRPKKVIEFLQKTRP